MTLKKSIGILSLLIATQAAAAPIQWQPWSNQLFENAQRDKKLVILDLEAVWCHWCHVMNETTYSDPKVQDLIDSKYIAVRVDQDSRPDLSNRYEDYGWPATIVFDPKGTELAKRSGYIPPAPMAAMLEAFIKDPTPGPSAEGTEVEIVPASTSLSEQLKKSLEKSFYDRYDDKQGGWGESHKFLDPDLIEYAMLRASRGDKKAEAMALQTLDAARALIDPVWGGVYQYSTGGRWDEPHFEKIMSYQTADLRMYAEAHALWGRPSDLASAKDIHLFLTNFLLSPEGAFYTSQDADIVRGEHSDNYFKKSDPERRKQGIPIIDKHIYARENGWAIEALTWMSNITGDETYLLQAKRAAIWVIKNRSIASGGFRHDDVDKAGPYLGDTLAMGRAFLALYSATGEREWLKRACDAAESIQQNFEGPNGFLTSRSSTAGFLPKPQRDENASAARFLNLLNHVTGQQSFRMMAEHAMRFLSAPAIAERAPTATVLLADLELSQDPLHITVIGSRKDNSTSELFTAARKAFPFCYRRLERWDPSEGPLMNFDVQYPELDRPAAFVCADRRCSLPLFTVEKLKTKINSK